MKIEVGQVWRRIPPLDSKFFPKGGWKVKITSIYRGVISHKLIEYNGEPRDIDLLSSHFLNDFLSMYELDE